MRTNQRWDWAAARSVCGREVRGMLGAGADADDVTQEAVLRAWRHQGQCRGAMAPWLRQVARREVFRFTGRRRIELPLDEAPPRAHPAADDLAIDVRHALTELPAADRQIVELRYVHDLTQQQVAQATGVPLGTAKVRLHRARKRLAIVLAPYAEETAR
jgi:RNA polymerase sigma-70 factor, ECF subfamily